MSGGTERLQYIRVSDSTRFLCLVCNPLPSHFTASSQGRYVSNWQSGRSSSMVGGTEPLQYSLSVLVTHRGLLVVRADLYQCRGGRELSLQPTVGSQADLVQCQGEENPYSISVLVTHRGVWSSL
ncbi:hypothetical protein J6590_021243 [Homalodisca vitripennis]|nr:hypothetical protein J6590_021243 [Homalodisca vitripennis]